MSEQKQSSDLIYGLNDRPPLRQSLFAALQHLLAIFVAIITPPLIISSALKFDLETTGFLVSMSLFVSGIATFIQCRRIGPLGAGLLCIQGTSFSFITPIIGAGMIGMVGGQIDAPKALSYIFGACMVASVVEMAVSRLLPYARKIITPLVSGIVVTLIGLCLIKAGINSCGGGQAAIDDGTFGSLQHLGLAILVLVTIIFFNRSQNKYIRMGSIVIGLIVGCVVAWTMGMIDISQLRGAGKINVPVPFKYGLHFDVGSIIALGIIYLAIAVEAGLLLAVAYKWSGTLWLPIGIHWAWNYVQGHVFGLAVSGESVEDTWLSTFVSGPDLLTGGDFGAEASVFSVVLGLALSILIIWRMKHNTIFDNR